MLYIRIYILNIISPSNLKRFNLIFRFNTRSFFARSFWFAKFFKFLNVGNFNNGFEFLNWFSLVFCNWWELFNSCFTSFSLLPLYWWRLFLLRFSICNIIFFLLFFFVNILIIVLFFVRIRFRELLDLRYCGDRLEWLYWVLNNNIVQLVLRVERLGIFFFFIFSNDNHLFRSRITNNCSLEPLNIWNRCLIGIGSVIVQFFFLFFLILANILVIVVLRSIMRSKHTINILFWVFYNVFHCLFFWSIVLRWNQILSVAKTAHWVIKAFYLAQVPRDLTSLIHSWLLVITAIDIHVFICDFFFWFFNNNDFLGAICLLIKLVRILSIRCQVSLPLLRWNHMFLLWVWECPNHFALVGAIVGPLISRVVHEIVWWHVCCRYFDDILRCFRDLYYFSCLGWTYLSLRLLSLALSIAWFKCIS